LQNILFNHRQTANAMAKETTILKAPTLRRDEDYAFLRSEGLRYIEELGSNLWTDYNEHDPGITILEALCFAITELGFRAGLPMKDLLTEEDGKIDSSQVLFTPRQILTQAPLTIDDYRKLLIDINGIHNAWFLTDDFYSVKNIIIPAGETPIFADCKQDALSYQSTPHPVYLSGLYKVMIDLDDDLLAGDLNNGELQVLSPAISGFNAGMLSFTVILPALNDSDINNDLLKANKDSLTGVSPVVDADGKNWKLSTGFSFSIDGDITAHTTMLEAHVSVDLKPANKNISLADMQSFFATDFTKQVIDLYIYKIQTAKKVVQSAVKKLAENRNLCEDFVSVDIIRDEEIAVCCDIDVAPDADMEEVQARVFYVIEEYLNPSLSFYLLQELVNKGYTTDEIFEGPVLEHGFIDTQELKKTQLRETIYASDIISLVMDIKGVLAVRSFRMTKYDKDGKPVAAQTGKAWCMPVSPWHKPILSETKSKILFYKNQFPYLSGLAEVRDTLRWLHAVNARNKLTGHADDLTLPSGKYVKLEEYTSIDYLFPQTYCIGAAGLRADATEERKAQAKQMKAYLLFYDQLLADFFSQLKNSRQLFSTNNSIQTYYGQYVNDIKDVEAIYKTDVGGNSLLKALLNNHDSTAVTANEWQQLYETDKTFIDRRNRFLDHLMSRFGESFNDYVLLMYSLDYELQTETKIDPAHMISNKIEFLKAYPEVSYERAKAFNYYPQQEAPSPANFVVDATALWDTGNLSGLEQKAGRLAGIENIYRRFLYCFSLADIIPTTDSPAKYLFVFKDEDDNTITSINFYAKESDAVDAVATFLPYAKSAANYFIEVSGTGHRLVIKDKDGSDLAASNEVSSDVRAMEVQHKFITGFNKECDAEGLHLIEHILLRPRNNLFVVAPVCLDADCDFCGEQDPYSFRISVVLPYWPDHFQNLAFRNYFENMIRREAPAHTIVKVCWLSNTAIRDFEVIYKSWLSALANYAEDKATIDMLRLINDSLINILFHLHSEYPVATLHDCDESKDANPVMLGRTILGSFKKE